MLSRRGLFFVLAILIVFSFTGCAGNNVSNNKTITKNSEEVSDVFPMTVTDSYGRQVKLNKEPHKVISVAPNITEIIFALGKSKSLIGRTEYCDYPEEAKGITSIGSLKEPSIEKIAELRPDLVIASTHFQKEILQKLEELGNFRIEFFRHSQTFKV